MYSGGGERAEMSTLVFSCLDLLQGDAYFVILKSPNLSRSRS